jgi:probable rRNA maturation factor
MVLNRQRNVALRLSDARTFVRRVREVLRLGARDFNVCFVDDARIAALNGRFRNKPWPTDVLSFPWAPDVGDRQRRSGPRSREFDGFLGDVVISAETARRNARAAGHSTAREIRWLILHGTLHLLGYDHATDQGEMITLELALRDRLRA